MKLRTSKTEKILKAIRRKRIRYKRLRIDFSSITINARRQWNNIFKEQEKIGANLKLSFKREK